MEYIYKILKSNFNIKCLLNRHLSWCVSYRHSDSSLVWPRIFTDVSSIWNIYGIDDQCVHYGIQGVSRVHVRRKYRTQLIHIYCTSETFLVFITTIVCHYNIRLSGLYSVFPNVSHVFRWNLPTHLIFGSVKDTDIIFHRTKNKVRRLAFENILFPTVQFINTML